MHPESSVDNEPVKSLVRMAKANSRDPADMLKHMEDLGIFEGQSRFMADIPRRTHRMDT